MAAHTSRSTSTAASSTATSFFFLKVQKKNWKNKKETKGDNVCGELYGNLFSLSADALLLYYRQQRQRLQAHASRADC